jgi:hypothetical protein
MYKALIIIIIIIIISVKHHVQTKELNYLQGIRNEKVIKDSS